MSLLEGLDQVPLKPYPDRAGRYETFLRRHVALMSVLAIGLVIRAIVLLAYLNTHDWKGETWEHETVAMNLLQGKGFMMADGPIVYRSREPPFFGFLCYLLHVVGGPSLGLFYLFQLGMAAAVIVLTYVIARRWFHGQTALAAALLVALEPGLVIYHSYKVDDLAFATFVILVVAHGMACLTRCREVWLGVAVGLLIGVGILTRPDLLSLLGLLLVWVVAERARLSEVAKPAAIVLLTALLVTAPWVLRNSLLHGKPVFLTTFSGEALWRGNNPNSTGSAMSADGLSQFAAAPAEFRQRILEADEIQRDRLFRAEAWRFIGAHPAAFVVRTVKKLYYFWWFTPTYGTHHYEWVPAGLKAAYRGAYGIVLVFALAGLWTIVREGMSVQRWLILSIPIWLAVLHSLSYVEGRHRVLVMPLIAILAGRGLFALPWLTPSGTCDSLSR